LKFGSVCSGIEAASVAFEPLGFTAQWFSEIEHFPSEVLKYRYPTVPNLGDMTKLTENETFRASSIDLLVGGTPCQSFSVAGLRRGLADPRGNLMLTFLALADAKKPRWIVWENVPGVLSSNGGKDFGTFLGALGELGYGFAYRVLDAQHFGVAQRRRRVFVVGYLGDWRPAAAVLFERESLSRDTKPSRKKGKETPTDAQGSVGEAGEISCAGGNLSPTVTSKWKTGYGGPSGSNETGNMVYAPTIINRVAQPIAFKVRGGCEGGGKGYLGQEEQAFTISTMQDQQIAQPIAVTITFNDANGTRADRPNGGLYVTEEPRCTSALTCGDNDTKVMQPIAVDWRTAQVDQGITQTLKTDLAKMSGPCVAVDTYNYTTNDHTTQTIRSQSDTEHIGAVLQPIAVDVYNQSIDGQTSATITEAVGGTNTSGPKVMNSMAIRRLTPKECERLQGFPDDWTKIPYRNKEADQCPDGPRYKACGNSMAVPVMRWIGKRIQLIDTIIN
jgi:DNA (cytosine-5)-methyltransferase 1